MTVTDLARHLGPNVVVLHDEPETHLHPRLLSSLLRAMRHLLETFDAYAILATHSLIPIQETPSSNVIILRVFPEAGIIPDSPSAQTFAAPLDEIEREVFGARYEDKNYQSLLRGLADSMQSSQISELLGGKLGLGARIALAGFGK
jgi:predicted ATP-dependent endonuclease of OLD family